jgi:ribosomal protein L37E
MSKDEPCGKFKGDPGELCSDCGWPMGDHGSYKEIYQEWLEDFYRDSPSDNEDKMTTKTVTLCDRCGKNDPGDGHESPWLAIEARWSTYRLGYGLHRHKKDMILCRECRKDFWQLFKFASNLDNEISRAAKKT